MTGRPGWEGCMVYWFVMSREPGNGLSRGAAAPVKPKWESVCLARGGSAIMELERERARSAKHISLDPHYLLSFFSKGRSLVPYFFGTGGLPDRYPPKQINSGKEESALLGLISRSNLRVPKIQTPDVAVEL